MNREIYERGCKLHKEVLEILKNSDYKVYEQSVGAATAIHIGGKQRFIIRNKEEMETLTQLADWCNEVYAQSNSVKAEELHRFAINHNSRCEEKEEAISEISQLFEDILELIKYE